MYTGLFMTNWSPLVPSMQTVTCPYPELDAYKIPSVQYADANKIPSIHAV